MDLVHGIALIGCGILALLILGFSIFFMFYYLKSETKTKHQAEKFNYKTVEVETYEEFLAILEVGSDDDWVVCATSQFDKGWIIIYSKPKT